MQASSTASLTARGAALHRAAHQIADRPLVFEDPLAVRMFGPRGPAIVRERLSGFRPGRRAMRAFLVARSRFVEDELAAQVAGGLGQYVLLGAGLDTFAYRNPFQDQGLQVFEVDHPATQQLKRRLLSAGKIAIPPSLTFAPVDFETESLTDGLQCAGFDMNRPALFAWLGVVPYLTRPAISATLTALAGLAPGTTVVFDYGEPPERRGLLARLVFGMAQRRLARIGEPWITFFDPPEAARILREAGFATVRDIAGPEINRLYFTGRRDGLRVRAGGHLAWAST